MNQPPTGQRADGEKPAGEQKPAPSPSPALTGTPAKAEPLLSPVSRITAAELAIGDLYRPASPKAQASDRADYGTDLWIVTAAFKAPVLLDRDDVEALLHAHPVDQPEDDGPQYYTHPTDEVDRLARLLDETASRSDETYQLTRVYRLPEHTLRVKATRNPYSHQSAATADLMTASGWTHLLAEPVSLWHAATPYNPTDIRNTLSPLATRLLTRAQRILTAT
ncbi:hypothetical protein [Parafrankia elaeagni]|uniref:hypothetical protein n=1 Tax=Parafrankia elaeagni TaxID=222534 RepID=UPI000362DD6B|nr:hypothetical protein [Parafrankia elaeagni]